MNSLLSDGLQVRDELLAELCMKEEASRLGDEPKLVTRDLEWRL